jgi:hypothetical protein
VNVSALVENLREDLLRVASVGGPEAQAAAERLAAALDPAISVRLLDLLGQVAAEVSAQLPSGRLEVRLVGSYPDVVFVPEEAAQPARGEDIELTARLTLRLPDPLKARLEQAAGSEGVSVNTWVVRALSRAISNDRRRPGRRLSGFGST